MNPTQIAQRLRAMHAARVNAVTPSGEPPRYSITALEERWADLLSAADALERSDVTDRLEVLEREHTQFFDSWHKARRLNEQMQPVISAAVALVSAPGWAGVSDEGCELEQALRDAGFVQPNGHANQPAAAIGKAMIP